MLCARVVRGMNFSFSGQSCGSTSRLIVHEDIHESFVGALAERIDGLRVRLAQCRRGHDLAVETPRECSREHVGRVVGAAVEVAELGLVIPILVGPTGKIQAAAVAASPAVKAASKAGRPQAAMPR